MTSERPDDDESLDEFFPRDEIDAVFGYGHPNPERVGCPPEDVLIQLARRRLPIDHHGYQHLDQCSPCYRHVAFLRDRRRLAAWRLAAALALAIVAGATMMCCTLLPM